MLPSSVEVKRRAHRNVHNPVYRRSWPMAPPHANRHAKVCKVYMYAPTAIALKNVWTTKVYYGS